MTLLDPKELTRPIIGIENRTPQEAFDIMCHRIAAALAALPQAEPVGWGLTAEGYVYEFIRRGERSTRKLEPWEQAYQDAELIDAAERRARFALVPWLCRRSVRQRQMCQLWRAPCRSRIGAPSCLRR